MKHFNRIGLFIILLSGVLIASCEAIGSNDEENENTNDENEENLVSMEDERVINRFPAINAVNIPANATVWIDLAESSALSGNVQAEIFEFSYDDSVWFEQSGIRTLEDDGPGSAPDARSILHTKTSREGNRILFPIDSRGGNQFKPAALLNGFQYLVHLYSDDDDFKIYWKFNTSPPTQNYSFSDTLVAEEFSANNKTLYIKLVQGKFEEGNATRMGEITDPALYWTKSTFSNDSVSVFLNGERDWADISISGIEQGDYAIWAFIDMNGNASGDKNALPDNGDYYTGVEEFGFYSAEIVEEWKGLLKERAWQEYQ